MLRCASLICFLVILTTCYAVTTDYILEKISVCHRNKPDFEPCLKDKLEALIPDLRKNGIPEIGIGAVDPFEMPEILVQYKNGNWSADLKIRDSKTWIIGDPKLTALRSDINDPKRFRMAAEFLIPSIYTEGTYKVDARLLVPIRSKGYYNITMTEINSTAEITGEHFQKDDGEDYVKIKTFQMEPEVGDMKIYASNLFPGNDELNQAALDFANRYWRQIYKELLPFTNNEWSAIAIDTMNKVFTNVPFNKIFPAE